MEPKNEKTNLKVLRTKSKLRDSLLTLMREKPIGHITPTELCRHAQINRNTFYTYYECPRALLQSMENDLYEHIRRAVEQSTKHRNSTELLTDIHQVILDNRELCVVLFSDFGDKAFLDRLISPIHDQVIAEWKKEKLAVTDQQLNYLYLFFSCGSISVIQKWTESGMKQSPKELAEFIVKTSHQGICGHIPAHCRKAMKSSNPLCKSRREP